MDGVLLIDKPGGLTSHDVVARLRRTLLERRIGHTGTLDPFATGVLVMLVGRATRLAQFLSGAEKEYYAVVRFGYSTDTGDFTGKPTNRLSDDATQVSALSWSDLEIEEALTSLRGVMDQVPPMYSAKKQGGRKLYELARRGETIERKPVRIEVRELQALRRNDRLLKDNEDRTVDLAVRIVCSAGTYIRTLAETLGVRLGVGAHLAELRRTRAGDFSIASAVTLDQIKAAVVDESVGRFLIPLDKALASLPFVSLSGRDARSVQQGVPITVSEHSKGHAAQGENVRMRDDAGNLLAVGCYDAATQSLKPRVVISRDN